MTASLFLDWQIMTLEVVDGFIESNRILLSHHITPTAGQRSKKRDQQIKWSVHLWERMVPHRWSQTLTPDPSDWVIVQVTVCAVVAYHLNRCCWAPWGEWWRLCIDREDTCEGTGPYRLYAPRGRNRKKLSFNILRSRQNQQNGQLSCHLAIKGLVDMPKMTHLGHL